MIVFLEGKNIKRRQENIYNKVLYENCIYLYNKNKDKNKLVAIIYLCLVSSYILTT